MMTKLHKRTISRPMYEIIASPTSGEPFSLGNIPGVFLLLSCEFFLLC